MRAHTSLPLPSRISQIDGLQALRAIAVILVAWLHISDYLHLYGAPQLPNLGVFGVDIFFVISGFILSSVAMREREQPGGKTMWRFLSRRLIRIYPVYWIFALLAMFRLWRSGQLFAQSYLAAFFLLPPLQYPDIPLLNTFAWTLIFEMTFYFLLALLLLRTVKFAPYALMLVLCACVGGGALMGIRRPILVILCNPILLEFVFGALIAVIYRGTGKRYRLGMACTIVGSVIAVYWAQGATFQVANGMQMIITDSAVFARVATFGVAALLIVGGVVLWSPDMKGFYRSRPRGSWQCLLLHLPDLEHCY